MTDKQVIVTRLARIMDKRPLDRIRRYRIIRKVLWHRALLNPIHRLVQWESPDVSPEGTVRHVRLSGLGVKEDSRVNGVCDSPGLSRVGVVVEVIGADYFTMVGP